MREYDLTPDKKNIIFHKEVKLIIASSQERFIECIEERAFTKEDFRISPINPKQISKSIVYYKGFVVVGFNGQFELTSNPILLQLALEAGLGGKNVQGF